MIHVSHTRLKYIRDNRDQYEYNDIILIHNMSKYILHSMDNGESDVAEIKLISCSHEQSEYYVTFNIDSTMSLSF
jgi:hypothetical protein